MVPNGPTAFTAWPVTHHVVRPHTSTSVASMWALRRGVERVVWGRGLLVWNFGACCSLEFGVLFPSWSLV